MSEFWENKRVLITGGAGFLGRWVTNRLRAEGCTDLILPRSANVDFRDGEIANDFVAQTAPDLLIHLAATVGGIGANMARPGELYLDNLLLGTNVIEAARQAGTAKTVVVGTICSYPKFTPVPFSEDSLWQGYPEETNAPYGIAKLAQLVQLQANRQQYGQSGIYLMPTNLYGPGDKFHPSVSHVIPALIKKAVEARDSDADSMEVWGTGTASREFLYVDDAARGIVLASEHYDGAEPINLGAHEEVPIKALVETITELVGFQGRISWDESKPDGQPRRCVDTSKAKDFGFEATTGFVEGLRATIDWFKANRQAAEAVTA